MKVMCPVKHIVMRNVEVIRDKCTETKGCMIRTKEDCEIDTLILNDIYASEMESFLKADCGAIHSVYINNAICENVTKGMVSQEGARIEFIKEV